MTKIFIKVSCCLFLLVVNHWYFLNVGASIIFTEEPKGAAVVEGGSKELNCTATYCDIPKTTPVYFWKKDSKFIKPINDEGIVLENRLLHIPVFNTTFHSGIYQCVAYCPALGSVISRPARLEVAYLRIQTIHNQTYTAADASYLLINAPIIQANPAATLSWYYMSMSSGTYVQIETTSSYLLSNGSLLLPSVNSLYSTEFLMYVDHPTLHGKTLYAVDAKLTVRGSSRNCPNANVLFLPNTRSKVVNEDQDVVLECLAVAVKCRRNVAVTWYFNGQSLGSGRKLVIKNIKKTSEGLYNCSAKVGKRAPKTQTFKITVVEKPSVFFPIPNSIDIRTAYTINYGDVAGFKTVDWYTNGDKITSNTNLFEVTSKRFLKIKYPNPSLSGVYQIFFTNDAGITVQTFSLFVNSGFGIKLTNEYGSIDFSNTQAKAALTYSAWQIQLPILEPIILTISKPPKCSSDGITSLSVYRGSTASGSLIGQYCSSGSFSYIKEVQGPSITLVLVTKDLKESAFKVHYSLKSIITTPPTVMTTQSTTPKSFTAASTRNTFNVTTSGLSVTSTIQTMKSTVGGIMQKAKGSSSPVGAIVGGLVGALAVVAAVIGLFCYRRRNTKKCPPSEMDSPGKGGSYDNTYMRPFQRPGTDQSLPQFTVQGKSMPDVVPSYHVQDDLSHYELGYVGPEGENADNQTYATVGEVIGSEEYPVIANQAYISSQAPKQSVGRRIASGPGQQYSKSLNPAFIERPTVLPLTERPSTNNANDYLTPIDTRNRLPSATGSNYSEASNLSGPQYQVLEPGENATYESADEVNAKMDVITRNPSDRSDNRYAALNNGEWSAKENSIYEPLTLGRNATLLQNIEDGPPTQSPFLQQQPITVDESQKQKQPKPVRNNATAEPTVDEGNYCDPYESKNRPMMPPDSDDEYSEPYEKAVNKKPINDSNNIYQPLSEDVCRKKLQLQQSNSNKYASLNDVKGPELLKSAEPLNLGSYDDDYAEI